MKTELLATLKQQATEILASLPDDREVLITEHGHPVAYLVDVHHYEKLQHKINILEDIVRGEMAIQEGRTLTHEQVKRRMSKWLN